MQQEGKKKEKLVTSAEGRVFVSVLIFVHFPEAVYSFSSLSQRKHLL